MAQVMDYAGYLAKDIGARPAGTEEEQQAALYITEQFQKEAGFTAAIEEFTDSSDPVASRAAMAAVVVLVTVLAIIFPILNIPALILALAATVIYVIEAFDKPVISKFLSRGASQNVVAKYQPAFDEPKTNGNVRGRTRKIVLVAHYDTGRVTPALVERIESSGLPIALICMGAMIIATFFQLLRLFMAPNGGMGLIVLNVLSILAIIVCLLPVAKAILMRQAPYNEGANNNATGVAALIEVSRRISRGSVSEADLANNADDNIYIHGEAAAREAGLVPEGAQIRYEAEQLVPPSELGTYDEEERLLAAKAAIAAMTGKPVERRVYGSVADKLVNSYASPGEEEAYVDPAQGGRMVAMAGGASASEGAVSAPVRNAASGSGASNAPREEAEGFENAPSWFVAAQKNARKSADEPVEIQRSRYTEALENAERERADREAEQLALEQAAREAELRKREAEARAILESRSVSLDGGQSEQLVQQEDQLAGQQRPGQEDLQVDPQFAQQADPQLDLKGANPQAERHSWQPDESWQSAPADDPFQSAQPDQLQPLDQQAQPVPAASAGPASPNSTIAMEAPIPAAEIVAEAAQLDEQLDQASQTTPSRERIAGLPAIDAAPGSAAGASGPVPTSSPSKSGILRKLRTNVPSLSGLIDPIGSGNDRSRQASNTAAAAANRAAARRSIANSVPTVVNTPSTSSAAPGAAPAASSTAKPHVAGAFEQVDYDMEVPVSSAFSRDAGNAHSASDASAISMDVPRSRSANLLSRLRRNDDELQETPQEWLDIDEDYEARSVGRDRGSWESFRDEQYFDDEDSFESFGTGDEAPAQRRRWQGGAYTRMQLGHVNMRSGAESDADEMIPEELPEGEVDLSLTGEIEQIYHFRNPQFNTEIWFVAIGSDTVGHDGAHAFIEEHADELRGAMVIEVESLGVGSLSVASEEGHVKKVTASSRIKRYTRAATAATGIALDEVSLAGSDSIASTIQKAGYQAMHLFGAENGRPALKGSADDVLENIDELILDDNVTFIYELLKG